jgi:ABC-type transport system involved in cytochrome c biogenesis permease subunit
MKELPRRNSAVRWVALGFLALGAILVGGIRMADKARQAQPRHIANYTPWSKETIAVAESIPIQDGGRVKPLSTFAGFTLYQIHGDRSMKIDIPNTDEGAKPGKDGKPPHKTIELRPTEWLLDCLFRPHFAVDLPMFRIDNSAVVTALGLTPGAKRDHYSYRDLQAGRAKLDELASTYERITAEKRNGEQQQTIDLAVNTRKLEGLFQYFAFTRGLRLEHAEPGQPQSASMSAILSSASLFSQVIAEAKGQGSDIPVHVKALLEQVVDHANMSRSVLLLYPPDDSESREWTGVGNEIMPVMTGQAANPERSIQRVKLLEELVIAAGRSDAEFRGKLTELGNDTITLAKNRGDYRSVPVEATYYREDWFLKSLVFFILGSLLAGGMWAAGWNSVGRLFAWATGLCTGAGFVLCTIAIVKRSYIMNRPPVGNLYDTIIFIGATIVLLSLIVELLTRRRFGLGIAPMLGASLVMLSRLYEVDDAKDHMDPLVAVLRSNYWLTTHVITIVLGYMAALMAAFISHIYVFMRGTGLDQGDRNLQRTLTRAAYGCVCFALFLSLVGTVLGGVWANDSWGRFWGWDPKENGALLIVLWNLAILHARLGGFLKEWAFHFACVFGSCIVMFSWWHVNFFNTGLHTYGFTSGKGLIWTWYILEILFIVAGCVMWMIQNSLNEARKQQRASHLPPQLNVKSEA